MLRFNRQAVCLWRRAALAITLLTFLGAVSSLRAQINPCIAQYTTNCYTPPTASLAISTLPRACAGGTFFCQAKGVYTPGSLEVQGTNRECVVVDVMIGGNATLVSAWWVAVSPGSITNTGSSLTAEFPLSSLTGSGTVTFHATYTNIACLSGGTTTVSTNYTVANCDCTNALSALVAWWPGDGNANDVVGTNNGTLWGNAGFTNGFIAQAFSFDGYYDGIGLTNAANLKLQNFTIEAWIKRDNTTMTSADGNDAAIFAYGSGGYMFGLNRAGVPYLTVTGSSFPTGGSYAITDTYFHHVAVTKTNSTVRYYVDGVPRSTNSDSSTFTFTTNPAIGARGDTFAQSFLGRIDELGFYNRALTAGEISGIYHADADGKCLPPLIVGQPEDQYVNLGGSATFDVIVSRTPDSYQWRMNGTNIAGATSNSYTYTPTNLSQSGTVFDVVVTSGPYNATSDIAVATVLNTLELPPSSQLNQWPFDQTNWVSDEGYLPRTFTNLTLVPSWSSNALAIGATNPAFLRYEVYETNGYANFTFRHGTIAFWFKPDWSSSSAGGVGPGTVARLLEVGHWTNSASEGAWSLYLNTNGTHIYFDAQNAGVGITYLNASISWASNIWHQIVVTHSRSNSVLYLDGSPVSTGSYIWQYPSHTECTNDGFSVGSDKFGGNLARGQFENLQSWDYAWDADDVSSDYAEGVSEQGGTNSFEFGGRWVTRDYGSTNWSIDINDGGDQVFLRINNSLSNMLYDILGNTNVVTTNWVRETSVAGVSGTTYIDPIPKTNRTIVFFEGKNGDLDGDGLLDWWEMQYFGHLTNSASADSGDGIPNSQKQWLGLDPTINQTATSGLRINYNYDGADWLKDVSGTSAVSGVKTGSVTLDAEGNVLSTSQ